MQGYLSRDGMPPADLLSAGRVEVISYGGKILDDSVVGITRRADRTFGLLLASGTPIVAQRLLVATGLRDDVVDIDGVTDRWGKDVLHCPYCHGHEVRDQALGVLGGNTAAVQHTLLVRQWSPDVVFFPHTTEVTDVQREQLTARAIGIVDGPVANVSVENDHLVGVTMADGRFIPRAAVFVRPTFAGNNDFLAGLGATVDAQGWASVDSTGKTTVPGVWAAGNAVNPRAQVITAAGEGSAAAIAINNDLIDEDVANAITAFRAGLPA